MQNISSHVLFISSSNCDTATGSIWDYTTNNLLKIYRNGGKAQVNTFLELQPEYFITAEQDKPLLHMWPVNKQEPIKDVRMVLPDPARCLAISPDNGFLTAAIGTKLYTWEVNTGLLLSVIEKHLQPITCLKFAGYYLISASESGSIITFAHSDLISTRAKLLQQVEPRYIRKDHTAAITDLHVGCFGVRSRFATCSTDCTCMIYQAVSGEPLLKLVLNGPTSSIVADKVFINLFIGTESGKIVQYSLCEAPRTFTEHLSNNTDELSFIGHKKRVNCLDVHLNVDVLVSGADDNVVYIWNVQSRAILNTIDLKGPVTNVRFIWNHINIYAESFQPQFALKSLRRDVDNNEESNIIVINNQYDVL